MNLPAVSQILKWAKWGLGGILLVVIAYYSYKWLSKPAIERLPYVPEVFNAKRPILTPSNISVADSSGELTEVSAPSGGVDQAVVVEPSDTSKVLFVRHQSSGWFPGITGRDEFSIVGLPGQAGTTITSIPEPLFGFSIEPPGVGLSYGPDLGLAAALTPVRVWAFHLGGIATLNRELDFALYPMVSLEVRDRLHLGAYSFGKRENTGVALYYQF